MPDTADLSVFTELGEIAFKSNNLKTHIDLSLRTGDFYSNGKGSYVELPANKYICYIDKLRWNMDEETLSLGENDENAHGSRFVSVHPSQDSLSFIAKTSTYNLKENIIKLKEVEEILVADAIVNPTEDFIIEKDIYSNDIKCRILANTTTKYHEFSNSTINILGRNNYTARGDYTYVDGLGQEQYIFFSNISVNNENKTIGTGQVNDSSPLNIGSKFLFKGNVNLISSNRLLTFDGFFKIKSNCNLIDEAVGWFCFRNKPQTNTI